MRNKFDLIAAIEAYAQELGKTVGKFSKISLDMLT